MKSKNLKKNVSAKKVSLGHLLKKNEKIKETVKKAASELTLVNEVLKQEKVPVQIMKEAVTQNEDVEQKVAKAADDLKLVNIKLTEEIAERIVIRWPVYRGYLPASNRIWPAQCDDSQTE